MISDAWSIRALEVQLETRSLFISSIFYLFCLEFSRMWMWLSIKPKPPQKFSFAHKWKIKAIKLHSWLYMIIILKFDTSRYCVSKKSLPILYSNFLYIMGQDILDIQYQAGLRIRVDFTRIRIIEEKSGSGSHTRKTIRTLPNFHLIKFTFYFFFLT